MKCYLVSLCYIISYSLVLSAIQHRSYIKRLEQDITRKLSKPSPGEGSLLLSLLKTYSNILFQIIETYKSSDHVLVSRIVHNLNSRNGPAFVQLKVDYGLLQRIYIWSPCQSSFVKDCMENITETWSKFKVYLKENRKSTAAYW